MKFALCPSPIVPVGGFDSYCGTSIILSFGSRSKPELDSVFSTINKGHHKIRDSLIAGGRAAFDVLHPSVIYVLNNGANITESPTNKTGARDFTIEVIKNIQTHGDVLNAEIMKEFALL